MGIDNSLKCNAAQPRIRPGNNGSKLPWVVVVYDHNGKPNQAKLERAKAKYRIKHPDYQWDAFNVIWVISRKRKVVMERVLFGRTALTGRGVLSKIS
jgi:hypothetical protein